MTVKLQSSNSHQKAEIIPQGAHISSWITSDEQEQLFVSKKALFAKGKAIRGGVPIIFPQFGAFGPGQKHGFARTANWTHRETVRDNTCSIFTLKSSAQSLKLWPYKFSAEFIVAIHDDTLSMTLRICNEDRDTFNFTAALHTYFLVRDIEAISIEGIERCAYWDNGTPLHQRQEMSDKALSINGPIDRVYYNTQRPMTLTDGNSVRTINAQGFKDSVIWNPGQGGAKELNDMDEYEYKNMICIESAVVDKPIELSPSQKWTGIQTIKFVQRS